MQANDRVSEKQEKRVKDIERELIMLIRVSRLFVLSVCFVFYVTDTRGDAPLQVSIVSDVQLIPEDESIAGFRLCLLHGRNVNMKGLDIGLLLETTQNADALQIAGLWNHVGNEMHGIQIAGLYNRTRRFEGVGIAGLFNHYEEEGSGLLLVAGIGNVSASLNGLQIAVVNWATYASGLQIGVINKCRILRGIQIGAINIIEEGTVSIMPILNMNF